MAICYASAAGNISTITWWTTSGGSSTIVPSSGDTLDANNKAVTVNQNTTAALLINPIGGTFTVSTSGITVTADVTATSVICLSFTHSSGISTWIAATSAGSQGGGTNGAAIGLVGNGTLTATGNATGGTGTAACSGIRNTSASGTLNITGNVTGGTGSATLADGCLSSSTSGTVTITGNAVGGTAHGASNQSTGTMTITGNATGGGLGGIGATNTSTGTLHVQGLAIGNGFGNGSSGLVAGFGVNGSQTGVTDVGGIQYGSLGMSPTSGIVKIVSATTNTAAFIKSVGGTKTLVDSAATVTYPATGDVRSGTTFNSGNSVGTLAVPAANQVAVGVATDNTTGTAVLTAANVLSAVTTDSTKWAGANIDAAISSRNSTTPPTVAAIRTEMDSNSTKLANLDATVSSRNATTPPTVTAIRTEMDSNSTKLANLDATVSSRNATTPPTVAAIRTEMDSNSTKLGSINTTVGTTATEVGAINDIVSDGTFGLEALKSDVDASLSEVYNIVNALPSFVHTGGKLWVLDENGNPFINFDPATDTVAHVTLTDTATTLTNAPCSSGSVPT